MAIFDGIFLISDIDGTLLDTVSEVPKQNIEKIKYFLQNGGLFSVATGRCADACRSVLEKFGLTVGAPVLLLNGAVVYDLETGRIIYSQSLDNQIKQAVMRIQKIVDPLVGIEIHSRDTVIDIKVTREIELHNLGESLNPVYMSAEQACEYEWNKVLFSFEEAEEAERVRQKLISLSVPPECIVNTNASLFDGVHEYLEIVPHGSNKGTGVQMLADYLGTDENNIYCIGDYYNDIPMLRVAGHSAAVSGAPNEVTAVAEFVSCTADGGAVGCFIDYIEERIRGNEN